jgi:polyisoprenoid-binding protein YceI
MTRKFLILLISIVCIALSFAQAQNRSIADGSKITFKIGWVSGSIGGLKGTVAFDPNDLAHSSMDVTLDLSTIATGISKRDKDIKEEAVWFNAAKFPIISFKSTGVTRTGASYIVEGMLTMKGVAKKVQIPFTYADGGGSGTFTGSLKLNRLDYGVGMSTILVSNNVAVTIIVAVKK